MYHIGFIGLFCILLLYKRFFIATCIIFAIIILIYKPIIILHLFIVISIYCITIRYRKVSRALRKAADSPISEDSIFLNFKFDMSETEVTKLTKKLISEGKLEYINYGADLSYKLTVSKIGRINFSYIDDKLSKLTIHFYGTTKEELCAIIHQELCNKQYSYYKDHLLSRIYYIKHNIIITLSYEEISKRPKHSIHPSRRMPIGMHPTFKLLSFKLFSLRF